jgi:hypothetical protein
MTYAHEPVNGNQGTATANGYGNSRSKVPSPTSQIAENVPKEGLSDGDDHGIENIDEGRAAREELMS